MVLPSLCPYREGDAGRPAAAEAGGGCGWLWTPRSSLVFINQMPAAPLSSCNNQSRESIHIYLKHLEK